MLKRENIRIRDPFIYTDKENGCYYMYGTTDLKPTSIYAGNSFSVYKSYDLENFEEPKVLFDAKDTDFWATKDFWAAEMHKYNGKYYLFGSGKADGKCRGTNIFVSDAPDGDFKPVSPLPATPIDWECLDGTFFVENGTPYIIFSHEWLQVHDGEIWAMPLTEDLSAPAGEPVKLFSASESPYTSPIGSPNGEYDPNSNNYVTDGPFFYREDGKLKMIWSSFSYGRYLVLSAESDSLLGKWTHKESIFDFDGGHAMVFYTLEGERMISLHAPNTRGIERPRFYKF